MDQHIEGLSIAPSMQVESVDKPKPLILLELFTQVYPRNAEYLKS